MVSVCEYRSLIVRDQPQRQRLSNELELAFTAQAVVPVLCDRATLGHSHFQTAQRAMQVIRGRVISMRRVWVRSRAAIAKSGGALHCWEVAEALEKFILHVSPSAAAKPDATSSTGP